MMYFSILCFCSALLLSLAISENITLSKSNHTINLTHTSNISKTDGLNETKLTLVSEGGAILPNVPNTLAKQKLNSLITLDEELSKTKEKAVVPRKGVDQIPADQIGQEENSSVHKSEKTGNVTLLPQPKATKTSLPTLDKTANNSVTSAPANTSTALPLLNTTVPHKKPLILSAEALASWDKKIQSEKPKMHSLPSSETMANSQIPSPNKDTIVKVYPSKANNSHPGMIMPIVITILVVPMFAIVGYMALKKGQEAWKNRHYKRMDFLLDGMYND